MKTVRGNIIFYLLLSAGLLVCFAVSLGTGPMEFSILKAFVQKWGAEETSASLAFWEIRLPRALLGVLVGATLGLAGAAMQGLLRNPLAEPGVLGVTGGAVLGAVLMLYTGLSAAFALALPLGGMAGAFISILVLYALAGLTPSIQTLILAGVALNTLAFAGTSLALNLSSNPYGAIEIVFWQMGSLANRSFDHVFLALPFILAGWVLLFWDGRALNALTLGETTAASMGIRINAVRFRLIAGCALCVGAAVSVTGSIGFVGLVVPHLLRPFVKQEPAKLLGASALGGAILILMADVLVRRIPVGTELKLGVLTSLIGAPFFIAILYRSKREIL